MGKSNENKRGTEIKLYKGLDHFEAPELVEPWAADEFPDRESLKGIPRRDVLKLMGGAAVLAGLAGCRYQPARKIVPFVQQPEGAVAGVRKHYATATVMDGYSVGLLVDQIDGRPVRIDGNPLHGSTLGSLNSQISAEILNLYDPDRMKNPSYRGVPATWNSVITKLEEALAASEKGAGFAVLSEAVNSPTVARLAAEWTKAYPGIKWHQYEPVNRDSERQAAQMAFGVNYLPIYDFTQADTVVSIDSDALHSGAMSIRYSRDIASRRNPSGEMSRIYAFESTPTTFGVAADHRARVKPSETLALVMAIAAGLGMPGAASTTLPGTVEKTLIDALVGDLKASGPRGVLVAGTHLPPQVQAAVVAVNQFLASSAMRLQTDPQPMVADHMSSLTDLVTAMNAGQVSTLLILGGNPVYTAPADLKFGEALAKVKVKAHLATHDCETSKLCDYALPQAHFLESWGDGVAFDRTTTITQPIIEPLYDGRSVLQVIGKFIGSSADPRELVRETAKAEDAIAWNKILARGFYSGSSVADELVPAAMPNLIGSLQPIEANGIELLILPDPMIGDGRNSNNMWLQETPNPITNLTWDNALLLSQKTADRLGILAPYDRKSIIGTPYYGKADMVAVTVNGATLEVPVWVNMGQADDVAVLHMGYGRTEAGDFGTKRSESKGGGFNANVLRTAKNPTWVSGVDIKKTGNEYVLANTQHHNTIDYKQEDRDRDVYKTTTLAALKAGHPFGEHAEGGHGAGHERDYNEFGKGDDISMYPGLDYENYKDNNYQWAMTIDLSLCTGCNACVTACQAENNIPTVGKEQVMRGREMHWIRVDRYYKGTGTTLDKDNPPIVVQPVTCMHCEQAPCEPVCPVAATTHSHEGLNQMVYNRCVGTRYCSNNCPYKVRRFNFFHFSQRADNVPVLKMLQNPDVTVRYRGVMEKCTYCVQRINKTRIEAKREDRAIADGEIKTACQVACPSGAIVFGDMRRPENAVAKSRADKRNYLMLDELNTRPRTSYLSRVTNPNPSLEEAH